MTTGFRRLLITSLCGFLLVAVTGLQPDVVQAKVYKWVDENGKVHFGDRVQAGAENKAEDISDEVSKQNIDSGTSKALEAKKSLFQGKTNAEQNLEIRQQNEHNANMAAYCQEIARRLSIIQGRVIFVNEDGTTEDRTEVERQQEEKKVRAEWEANCQGG